ncbi:MAG: mitofilin family membrane protein, partial [Rhodospirillales bacterium]|nr:mitofilin family membrane protein [Rhodospirillales bacterium]
MADDKAPESTDAGRAEGPGEPAAQQVIAAFGGIRPMAGKLGVAVSTVQGWKERNAIPAARHGEIRAAAERHGIDLDPAVLAESGHPPAGPILDLTPEAVAVTQPAKPAAPEPSPKPEKSGGPAKSKLPESSSAGRDETAATKAAPAAKPEPKPGPEAGPPPKSPPGPPPAPPARPSSGGWLMPFLFGAVVMALGGLVAIFTVDFWRPGAGVEQNGTAVAALEQGLDGLRRDLGGQTAALEDLVSKVADLPAQAPAGPSPEVRGDLAALNAAAEDFAARLGRLEKSAGTPAASPEELASLSSASRDLGGRVAALEARLGELDRFERELDGLKTRLAARPTAGGQMALMLALVQLRDALGGSGSYEPQLAALRAAAAGDGELGAAMAPLAPRAARGVPTVAMLSRSFSKAAGGIVAAGAGEEADGPLSGVLRRLSDVVTVRPIGDVEGPGAGAVVARAEHRLQAGDLAGAVQELDGLSGPAAEAAAAWRSDAEARLAADAALAALGAQVVAKLSPAGG